MSWYRKCLRHYVDFRGRARRREYWYFALFNLIFALVAAAAGGIVGGLVGGSSGAAVGAQAGSDLYAIGTFLPGLAVLVRRLHDVGKSGWWCLISLIPFVGPIWLIVLLCLDSRAGTNKWGPNPKDRPGQATLDTAIVQSF